MQSLQKMLMNDLHVVAAVDDDVQRRDLLIRLLDIKPCLQVDMH